MPALRLLELMTHDVKTIAPDSTLKEAALKMLRHDISVLVVVGRDRLLGAITDRDIGVRAVAEGLYPTITRVQQIMDPAPCVCPEDRLLEEALARMTERRSIFVIALAAGHPDRLVLPSRRVTGILTLGDLARRHPEGLAPAAELLVRICRARDAAA